MFFNRFSISLACLFALATAPGVAQANLVVDTGAPSNEVGAGWAFNSGHSYAGQFSLLSDMTINSIEGYFSTEAGSIGISLFSDTTDGDGGFIPGNALHTTNIATGAGALGWSGASALDWAVTQGTYWIVFTSSYSSASQSSMPGQVVNPLSAYALEQAGQWYDAADLDLGQGLRVDATPAVAASVPEPGSIALFGLGMIGASLVRRRKQA
jgi:hypothetical protein